MEASRVDSKRIKLLRHGLFMYCCLCIIRRSRRNAGSKEMHPKITLVNCTATKVVSLNVRVKKLIGY